MGARAIVAIKRTWTGATRLDVEARAVHLHALRSASGHVEVAAVRPLVVVVAVLVGVLVELSGRPCSGRVRVVALLATRQRDVRLRDHTASVEIVPKRVGVVNFVWEVLLEHDEAVVASVRLERRFHERRSSCVLRRVPPRQSGGRERSKLIRAGGRRRGSGLHELALARRQRVGHHFTTGEEGRAIKVDLESPRRCVDGEVKLLRLRQPSGGRREREKCDADHDN